MQLAYENHIRLLIFCVHYEKSLEKLRLAVKNVKTDMTDNIDMTDNKGQQSLI
jgi:hypothetical protein